MNKKLLGTLVAFCLLYLLTIAAFGASEVKIWLLAPPLIWLSIADLEDQIVPDLAVLAIATWGIVARDSIISSQLLINLGTAITILTVLWAIGEFYWRKTGKEALGFGDAKLLAASVLCVGWENAMWMVVLAAIGGIALMIMGRMFRGQDREGIPFGPFIGYALFLMVNKVGGF